MNYTEEELDIIVADSLTGINYKHKKLLLAASSKFNADRQKYEDALIKIVGGGVYNKIRTQFSDDAYRQNLLKAYAVRGVECVTVKSDGYPHKLKHVPDPPLLLYTRGNRELLKTRMLGVVGSRVTLPQVIMQCKSMCSTLSEYVTIVTGVADGGDGAAAEGALDGGNVICVLPYGHGASGTFILKKVEEAGLSVSEYPPGTKAQRFTFNMRNRIIAGLCDGVLVVSAGNKSGALSTANYAADFSRDVFAFPYGLGVSSGVGCNTLIKNGAYLADCAEDILSVLGIECAAAESLPQKLDDNELAVVELLKREGELHAQRIAALLDKKLSDVITVCSMLEIKGVIVKCGSNSFACI